MAIHLQHRIVATCTRAIGTSNQRQKSSYVIGQDDNSKQQMQSKAHAIASKLITRAKSVLNDELKKELNAVFLFQVCLSPHSHTNTVYLVIVLLIALVYPFIYLCFQVAGKNYLMDAHASRPLKIEPIEQLPTDKKVDVTLITDEETFLKLAQGKLKPMSAYLYDKLKIKGNLDAAIKVDKVLKKIE